VNFILQFFNSNTRKIIVQILSYIMIASTLLGFVNPAVPVFTPKDIVTHVDNSEKMTLINNGESGYVIVRGANASPSETTASTKLQGFLKQISGVQLQIVTDAAAAQAKEIIVGKTNREGAAFTVDRAALGDDGFIIKTAGQKLIIAGGEVRGTLYGIFDFFEKFLDCAWLSADVTIIPEKSTVAIPAAIDEYEVPAFPFRAAAVVYNMTVDSVDYALANKINGTAASVKPAEYGGTIAYYPTHNAAVILPPSDYFADHPEYYALTADGKRISDNPCLSNENVIQIYIDYAKKQIAENPGIQSVAMCLNDSGVTCQCPNCKAIYAEDGATSGTLVRLLNRVSDAIKPINPNVKIITLAYASTVEPPTVACRDNILIYFCPITMCYAHLLQTCESEDSIAACRQLKGWGKVAKNILIFEYPMDYHEGNALPYAKYDALQPNIRFYYENNVRGLFNCTPADCDPNFFVLDTYLYAKLLWNPNADMKELMRSFLSKYYGDGWQYIAEYLRMVSEECNGKSFLGVQMHMICAAEPTDPGLLSMGKKQVAYCNELWANAKALAKEDWQLKNLRSCEISWRVWKADNFAGEFSLFQLPSKRVDANKQLFADLYEFGITKQDGNGVFVSKEDFDKFSLYKLMPTFWTRDRLGRENLATANNLFDLILGL